MKLDTYAHSSLKAQFNADMQHTRTLRRKGCKMIRSARKQRRDICADATLTPEETSSRHTKANAMTLQGIDIRDSRCGDRSLTLALAFLNNTPYSKCESNPATEPDYKRVCRYIQQALPKEKRGFAEMVTRLWLERKTLRRSDLLKDLEAYSQAEDLREKIKKNDLKNAADTRSLDTLVRSIEALDRRKDRLLVDKRQTTLRRNDRLEECRVMKLQLEALDMKLELETLEQGLAKEEAA